MRSGTLNCPPEATELRLLFAVSVLVLTVVSRQRSDADYCFQEEHWRVTVASSPLECSVQ